MKILVLVISVLSLGVPALANSIECKINGHTAQVKIHYQCFQSEDKKFQTTEEIFAYAKEKYPNAHPGQAFEWACKIISTHAVFRYAKADLEVTYTKQVNAYRPSDDFMYVQNMVLSAGDTELSSNEVMTGVPRISTAITTNEGEDYAVIECSLN